jgi:hypothetical protein
MKSHVEITPNDEETIQKFAEDLGISLDRARYIESMRATFMAWEHDYLKETPEKLVKKRRKVST